MLPITAYQTTLADAESLLRDGRLVDARTLFGSIIDSLNSEKQAINKESSGWATVTGGVLGFLVLGVAGAAAGGAIGYIMNRSRPAEFALPQEYYAVYLAAAERVIHCDRVLSSL